MHKLQPRKCSTLYSLNADKKRASELNARKFHVTYGNIHYQEIRVADKLFEVCAHE